MYVLLFFFFISDIFGRLRFTDSFAFGAERLISHHVAIWMIGYAGQVIVGAQPSKDCVGGLLYASSIGTHTSVVYINKITSDGTETFNSTQYIWEHRSIRPNTFSYPLACPSCHRIYSWRSIPSHFVNGDSAHLVCVAKVGTGKCGGTWEVPALPSSSKVDCPYVGTWRRRM